MPPPRLRTPQATSRGPIGNQRGQALVETGIVVVFLVILLIGIVEFGRAWMVANMITHACRDGARTAAVAPATSTYRNPDGTLTGATQTAIQNQVLNEISNVMVTSTLNTPTITQNTASGIPIVTVGVTGTVPYIFGLFGSSLAVNRSITFRDEGR